MRAQTLPNGSSNRNSYQSRPAKSSHNSNNSKTEPTLIDTPRPISSNLVSLVTKFETLDALNLPCRTLSLQPAPLQISPRPRRRGGGGAGIGHFGRLSTIFGPPSRSGVNNEDPFVSDDDPMSGRDTFFNAAKALSKGATRHTRKLLSRHSRSSITTRAAARNQQGTPTSTITAPYVKNGFPNNHKGSIRDMIKLYDGAASDGVYTQGKTSTVDSKPPDTPTPMSRKRIIVNRDSLSPSTGNLRYRAQQAYGKVPESLSRADQLGSLLEIAPGNESATSQHSPSKSSLSSMRTLSRTYGRVRYEGQVESARLNQSSVRWNGDENTDQGPYDRSAATSLAYREPGRGRSLIQKDKRATFNRNHIGSKIESLYQAKSMERQQESVKGQSPRALAPTTVRENINTGKPPVNSEFGRYLRRKSSKVIAMANLFDKASVPKPSIMDLTPPRQRPVFSKTSPFAEQIQNLTSGGVGKPPTPPPLLTQHVRKRNSTVSPKTIQVPMGSYSANDSPAKTNTGSSPQAAVLQKKASVPKARSITEKVQLFENARNSQDTEVVRKRTGFVRKLSRSLKSLFEPPPIRRNDEKSRHERFFDGGQPRAIMDEVRQRNKPARIGKKTSPLTRRWNAIPAAPVTSGCDGAISEKGVASPSAAEVQGMVIKEADCGLKEPKPVRVMEVKRMMLICKERFEDMMDKEKVQVRRV